MVNTNPKHIIYSYIHVCPWQQEAEFRLARPQQFSHSYRYQSSYVKPRKLSVMTRPEIEIDAEFIAANPELAKFWIETHTGAKFYYIDLTACGYLDINLQDITKGCSEEPMFSSQTKGYTPKVAQHAMQMWSLGRLVFDLHDDKDSDCLLGLLLHDAYKAYIKDIGGMLRGLLACHSSLVSTGNVTKRHGLYEALVEHIRERIYKRFEVSLSEEEEHIIRACNDFSLYMSTWDCMVSRGEGWKSINKLKSSVLWKEKFAALDFPACLERHDGFQANMKYSMHYQDTSEIKNWYEHAFKLYGVE